MNLSSWLIPLLLAWPLFMAFKILMVAKNLMGIKISAHRLDDVPPENVPAHYRAWARPHADQLIAVGFRECGWFHNVATASQVFSGYLCQLVLDGEPIRAVISRHNTSQRTADATLLLYTTLANGDELVTSSTESLGIVPRHPTYKCVEMDGTAPAGLLAAHRARVTEALRQGTGASPLDLEAFRARRQLLLDAELEALKSKGMVSARADGTYSYKLVTAVVIANRLLRRLAKRRRRKPAPGASAPIPPLPPELQLEFEMELYRRQAAIREGKMTRLPKAILMVGSLVLFALALGWRLSPLAAAIIIAVLVFHECGHLLGMKLFGFRDTQLLFIPFLGGAAVGFDAKLLKAWQYLVVLFLGPLPGLFIGIALLTSGLAESGWQHELALMLVFLNGFNLLPILPLDGGQIMDTAFVVRFPSLKVFFSAASALGLILISFLVGGGTLLAFIGVLMLLQLPAQWRGAELMRDLRREIPADSDDDASARLLIRYLADHKVGRLSSGARALKARSMLLALRQPLPTWGALALALIGYTSPLWLGLPIYYYGSDVRFNRKLAALRTEAAQEGLATAFPAYKQAGIAASDNAALALRQLTEMDGRDPSHGDPDAVREMRKVHSKASLDPESLALLKEAARRPGFDPAPEWLDAQRTMLRLTTDLQLLVGKAGERRKLHDGDGSIQLLVEALRVERHLRSVPAYWGYFAHAAILSPVLSTAQDVVADEASVRPESIASLAEQLDPAANFSYLRDALLLQWVSQEHTVAAYRKQLSGTGANSLLILALGGWSNPAGDEVEGIERELRLKKDLDLAASGHWPRFKVDSSGPPDLGVLMLPAAGIEQAQLELARAALAVCWQLRTTQKLPEGFGDLKAPWWHGIPRNPVTGKLIEWKIVEGVGILSFPTDAKEAARDEDVLGEASADLSWTLPVR